MKLHPNDRYLRDLNIGALNKGQTTIMDGKLQKNLYLKKDLYLYSKMCCRSRKWKVRKGGSSRKYSIMMMKADDRFHERSPED
jgi:hypothetical protein